MDEVRRIQKAEEAYRSVSGSAIRHMFAHCGLTEGDPEEVSMRLLSRGAMAEGGWADFHEEQHRKYLKWRADNHTRILGPHPVSLGDSGLDGARWRKWKSQHQIVNTEP